MGWIGQLGDTRARGVPPLTIENSPGFQTEMVECVMMVGFLCRFLFGIVKFSEIIVVPSKKALLLDEVAAYIHLLKAILQINHP